MYECARYAAAGVGYAEAWRIMAERCEVPPSLEVFDHVLTMLRGQTRLLVAPEWLAQKIAQSYVRQ